MRLAKYLRHHYAKAQTQKSATFILKKGGERAVVKSSSIRRQKGESQNGGNKKTKHAKCFTKRTFLTLLKHKRTHAYQEVRNVRFLENLASFDFLLPPF